MKMETKNTKAKKIKRFKKTKEGKMCKSCASKHQKEMKDLLKKLRTPFGKLYKKTPYFINLKKKLIVVGDIASYNILRTGVLPWMIVYDKKSRRRAVDKNISELLDNFGDVKIVVKNPRGSVSDGLINAIKLAAASNRRTGIYVKGEEDLAALPAIIYAPRGSAVLYGFPIGAGGVVFVDANRKNKEKAKKILKKLILLKNSKA